MMGTTAIVPSRRHPPGGDVAAETMRELRVAVRLAMRSLTLDQAAARAECHRNTLSRIIRGDNVSVRTAARIVEGLGCRLHITLTEEKHNIL